MEKQEHEEVFEGSEKASPATEAENKPEDLRILEALLFASDELMTAARLKAILPGQPDVRKIRHMVEKINAQLQKERHPFEIVEIGGGYQFRTITFYHPWVRQIFKEKAIKKLSIQALECLAIIAYKQPISKAEIEAIRGVVSDGAMKTLLEKRLVTISGRSDKPGRPLLYATTHVFLTYFGLNKIEDMPRIEEFEALAKEKMEELSMEELANQDAVLDEEALLAESGGAAEADPGESSLFEVEVVTDAGKETVAAENDPGLKEESAAFIDTAVFVPDAVATEIFEVTGTDTAGEEFDIESALEDIPVMPQANAMEDVEMAFEPAMSDTANESLDANAATAVIVPQTAPVAAKEESVADFLVVSPEASAGTLSEPVGDVSAVVAPEVTFEKDDQPPAHENAPSSGIVESSMSDDADATVFDFEKPAIGSGKTDDADAVFEIGAEPRDVARFSEEDIEVFGGALMETKAIKPDALAEHSKSKPASKSETPDAAENNGDATGKKPRKRKGE